MGNELQNTGKTELYIESNKIEIDKQEVLHNIISKGNKKYLRQAKYSLLDKERSKKDTQVGRFLNKCRLDIRYKLETK